VPIVRSSLLLFLIACGGSRAPDPRYPERAVGCDVEVYADAPPMPVDDLGTTTRVSCGLSEPDKSCLQKLKDEVCALGGDVVSGVPPRPVQIGDTRKLWGQPAHTRRDVER
jgi:hypothetical protein